MSISLNLISTKELVAKYNALSGKPPITKFSSRSAGEKQVQALLDKQAKGPTSKPLPKADVDKKPKAPKAPKAERPKKTPTDRSEAIARSWLDTSVHEARATRTAVVVDNVYYKSTLAAFRALRFPLGGVIKFRMALKAAKGGKAVFEHNGNSFQFTTTDFVPGKKSGEVD